MAGRALLWMALTGWAARALAGEGGIAVETPEAGCPARAQIVSALEARLPGVTAGAAWRRLELEGGGEGPVLRLRGAGGGVELERRLTQEAAAGSSREACEALAEAAALVVVRYLREIGYRPPAPVVVVTPPPRGARELRSAGYLGVAAAARAGAPSSLRGEAALALQVHVRRVAGEVGAGATLPTMVEVPGTAGAGELRLRSFPLRAAVGVPVRVGASALVPAAGVSVEVLSFRASGLIDARRGTRLEPAAELGLSYLVAGRAVFGRVGLWGGLTLGARDFDAGQVEPVFRTPGAYLRGLIEVGLVLWKNERLAPL